MSLLAIQSRKQHSLQDSCSSQPVDSSAHTWYSTTYTSSTYSCSPQPDTDLLDPLDDIILDSLDQHSTSSSTLLSRRVSSSLSSNKLFIDATSASDLSTLSESRQSPLLYPLHEPGHRTAERTKRLRARTAAVITSIPATCENVDEHEPHNGSKLRRVSGARDLRRAFRGGDHAPEHCAPIPLGVSKASYELGILTTPPLSPLSPLSPRSSLSTLVEVANALPQKYGDVKTLCRSTLSSISISSRLTTKLHSTFSSSRTPQDLPIVTSQPSFPRKYHVHSLSLAPSRRHTSLNLNTALSRSPGETVWSCAKITQSSVKRAARRGHVPRRVFSNPIVIMTS